LTPDLAGCRAILHNPAYKVADLNGYYEALERDAGISLTNVRGQLAQLLFLMSGPRHVALRRTALGFFSTANVQAWRPMIARCASEAAERLVGRAEADLVADFARPLSGEVMCHILGFSPAHWEAFDEWTSQALMLIEPMLPMRRLIEIEGALGDYAAAVALALADAPRRTDGPPTFLMTPIQGIDDTERLWLTTGLYGASSVTRHTLANILLITSGVASADRAVLATPARRAMAVERLIAAGTSFQTVGRYFEDDASYGRRIDVPIAEASRRMLGGGCPLADAQAGAGPHLAFGSGVHHCVGAPLARQTIAEALHALLARFPNFQVTRPPQAFERSATIVSPLDLHCRLQ
jgi:cytochrome P450